MGRTKKEDEKAIINIGVRKDGRVFVDTKEEYIPTKYVQDILDKVVGKILADKINNKDLLIRLKEAEKECKIWKFIAYAQIVILIVILLINVL